MRLYIKYMERSLGIVALMFMLSFAACNDNEPAGNGDQVPVQLCATIADTETGVARTPNVKYWTIDEFTIDDVINVDAWHFHDLNGVRKSESVFFSNLEMTYDGSSWAYSPVKYWPNIVDEKLAVCAYNVCESTSKTEYCTIDKNPTNGYSMTFANCVFVDDVVVAPLIEVNHGEIANLQFYHIMSLIKMQAKYIPKAGADPNDNYLTIKNVVLNWHSKGGKFTGFSKVAGVPVAQWSEIAMDGNNLIDETDYMIEANEDFKDLTRMTFCQIPFESPCKEGSNDRYSKITITIGFDDEPKDIIFEKNLTFKLIPGETTIFNIIIDGKDIDVTVSSNLKWSGDGGSTSVTF